MNRSHINEIIRRSDAFIRSFGYVLPPFAYLSPQELKNSPAKALIHQRGMGWDITDYGQGKFEEMGLFLFTVRNGNPDDLQIGRGMLYAEKIMISKKDQLSPMHRHIIKTEDIINRGGGDLIVELFASDENGDIDRNSTVSVEVDGALQQHAAGTQIKLEVGESVTLVPGVWHAFWGDRGDVLIGEVSTVNDDKTDNVFEMQIGRFADVSEDEGPLHLLVSDYDNWL